MKTYNFIYTIDNKEYQVEINATSYEEAWEIIKSIYPESTKIVLL